MKRVKDLLKGELFMHMASKYKVKRITGKRVYYGLWNKKGVANGRTLSFGVNCSMWVKTL